MNHSHHAAGAPPGASALASQAAEAGTAFAALRDAAETAAEGVDQAFAKAGQGLAVSLTKAAATGKLSFADLAKNALQVVEGLLSRSNAGSGDGSGSSGSGGVDLGGLASLSGLAASALGDLFGGARADGGPAVPGAAYLVGEQGPELFRPGAPGQVQPFGTGPLTINVQVQGAGGAADLARSDTQIAQALARAVKLGLRS